MSCDVATQGKRLGWEKLVDEAAPCRAARGFRNTGSFPKYFWVIPDTVQPTPWFNFLNGGVVIAYNNTFPNGSVFDFGGLLPIRSVVLSFIGFNEHEFVGDPPLPWTVNAGIRIGGVNPADPLDAHGETSALISLTPEPRSTWVFGNWVNQVPGGAPPTFVGNLSVHPLKQCHDCTTGP